MNIFEKFLGPVGVMPSNQVNASIPDDLMMRVGIPHKGGQLAIHADRQQYPAMVSASAFWDARAGEFKIPSATPLQAGVDWALDSAGYTAMLNWQQKGPQAGMASIFPWTYSQYIALAAELMPTWWSAPDTCCEPAVAANQEEIDWRIRVTGTLLHGTLQTIYEWQEELSKDTSESTVASMLRPCVGILQGWRISDYLRSLDMLMDVWDYWSACSPVGADGKRWLAPPALIGLGSVCRREPNHPEHGLFAILDQLAGRLPKGCMLHLFGVKGTALERVRMYDFVASVDSMAFDVTARVKARQSNISNSMAHRKTEMTRWMDVAAERMKPKAGDQFRLSF
ncbi:hypothetical protein [Paraburkholderia sp. SIMBA_054]|uniref:deazapurine DNA modification protein DpdA family protein n=1 Tax=Paraburkholderia sp. SIMBA_054 TaxID=3085795 RepID=UPI00397E0449